MGILKRGNGEEGTETRWVIRFFFFFFWVIRFCGQGSAGRNENKIV